MRENLRGRKGAFGGNDLLIERCKFMTFQKSHINKSMFQFYKNKRQGQMNDPASF
jgi:hypothetical protein